MFKVGDYAVYPGHGIGKVSKLETKTISGMPTKFGILEILDSGMKIMFPIENVDQLGIRKVISESKAKSILRYIAKGSPVVRGQTWNKRYREFMEDIKSGDAMKVAEVLVSIQALNAEKDLSFGERKMLDTARTLLSVEISVALGLGLDETVGLMAIAN